MRKFTKEPYFVHCCGVESIVEEEFKNAFKKQGEYITGGFDSLNGVPTSTIEAMICASYLHDIIEDTEVTEEIITQEFNEEIASLVVGLTKIDQEWQSREEKVKAEFFRLSTQSIEVKIIKLADIIHNLSNLVETDFEHNKDLKFSKRYVDEKRIILGSLTIKSDCILLFNIHKNLYKRADKAIQDAKSKLIEV